MLIWAALHLISCVIFAELCVLILIKYKVRLLHVVASLLFLCFSLWSFFSIFRNLPVSESVFATLVDIGSIANQSISSFTLYTILLFTGWKGFEKFRRYHLFLFTFPIVFSIAQIGFGVCSYKISDNAANYWEHAWTSDVWRYLFSVHYHTLLLVSMALLVFYIVKNKPESTKIKQAKIILYCTLAAVFFGNTNTILSLTFDVPNLADVISLVVVFGIYYSITKYKLFDLSISSVAPDIVSIMPECVALLDANMRIKTANPSFVRITGYSYDELNQLSVEKFYSADFIRELKRCNEQKIPQIENFETRLHTRKGKQIPVISSGIIVKNNTSHLLGFVCISLDIRARKKAEDVLRKAHQELEKRVESRTRELRLAKQKAEEADRLKSAFLANMSHEIRTPLNGILGFASLLQKQNLPAPKTHEYLRIIEQSGKQLLTVINDIIDISKIEAGQLKIQKTSFSLNSLILDLYAFYQYQSKLTEKPNLTLKAEPQNGDFIVVNDKNRLRQVFINLLDNAVKFTDSGFVKYGYEIVAKDDAHQFVRFYVSDTGIGLSQSKQQIIFERFRQVDFESTRQYGGTGLGLSISKALIEMMGGSIWVKSQPGKGATFYFTIPFYAGCS